MFLIVGEVCTDIFMYGKADRLSPEAPVPVFVPQDRVVNLGMAGNVSNNIQAILNSNNEYSHVNEYFSDTKIKKTRFVDKKSNHIFLRMDENDSVDRININEDLIKLINNCNTIIISDYNKGFLTEADIIKIATHNKQSITILDSKKILTEAVINTIDFIKMNEKEVENNLDLHDKYPEKIIVTLGSKGTFYNNKLYPVEQRETIDVSGAGDTFVAAFAYKYSKTKNVEESILFANMIASIVVTKKGVSTI